ncbi:MAG TPA: glycosyltransferase family 9 protein [Chloroflexota bacterium]|nr:glycosyltransferase family 9 protein [Chloroflexota bacterium]
MKRGLFVELLGGIGDLIFALPALDALASAHPDLRWDVFTFAPAADLLIGDPRFGEVYGSPKGTPEGDERPHCWHELSGLLERRAYEFIVTDTRHSGIHELIEASGAPRTVTQLWRGTGPEEPIARLFLRRLREEGGIPADLPDRPPRLFLSEEEREGARDAWASLGLPPNETIVFNPHAGMAIKRWPAEFYVALGQALGSNGRRVAVLEGERPLLAEGIARAAGARIVPRRSLRETAACLEGIALLVSADSGLAHLANAVGTPVVGVYGPTWAGRYGIADPARNLQSPFDCPERQPMNFTLQRCWYTGRCIFPDKTTCCADVSVESVLAAVEDLLPPRRHHAR